MPKFVMPEVEARFGDTKYDPSKKMKTREDIL
jgi:hypothetical protein